MTIPDGLLWHYTGFEAFEGMAAGNYRSSDIRYLNDTKEYEHYVDIAVKYIEDRGPPFAIPGSVQVEAIVRQLRQWARSLGFNSPLYVTCFSKLKDDLSQWRGYASSSIGLALGFDRDLLAAAGGKHNLKLHEVEYDEKKQQDELNKFIEGRYARACSDPRFKAPWGGMMTGDFYNLALTGVAEKLAREAFYNKSAAFDAEEEERLCGTPKGGFKLHASRSLLVPYTEWDAPSYPYVECPIKAVLVAPGPHKTEIVAALKSKYAGLCIEPSKVPYRNW
jgi:hypothetical protein